MDRQTTSLPTRRTVRNFVSFAPIEWFTKLELFAELDGSFQLFDLFVSAPFLASEIEYFGFKRQNFTIEVYVSNGFDEVSHFLHVF